MVVKKLLRFRGCSEPVNIPLVLLSSPTFLLSPRPEPRATKESDNRKESVYYSLSKGAAEEGAGSGSTLRER